MNDIVDVSIVNNVEQSQPEQQQQQEKDEPTHQTETKVAEQIEKEDDTEEVEQPQPKTENKQDVKEVEEKPQPPVEPTKVTSSSPPPQRQQEQQQPKPQQQPQPKPQPQPQPQQSSGGWGGWFSSVASAVTSTVTSTITSITTDDEPDPEPLTLYRKDGPVTTTSTKKPEQQQSSAEQKKTEQQHEDAEDDEDVETKNEDIAQDDEEENVEGTKKAEDDDEDDVEGLLNVLDKGVFKTADIIAGSLFYAGNLFSSGLKTVQENAKIENVKGLAHDVANISLETTRKATNSEIYGKGQKIASQMMDTSVERLESVGQRAYTLFAETKKNMAQPGAAGGSPPTGSTAPGSPPGTSTSTTTTSSTSATKNKVTSITLEGDVVFPDNQFDSARCFEHFKIPTTQQEIERISIESTMKIHQFNRKVPKDMKSAVEALFTEIKETMEDDTLVMNEKPKSLTTSNQSFELEEQYNEYFGALQEYLPKLSSQSQQAALCRGLEKMIHLASIGIELINSIAQSDMDQKQDNTSSAQDDTQRKESTLSKAKDYSYLINKIVSDTKSISSVITEIVKTKQNPQTRKYLNTISIETNNVISTITDARGCFVAICSLLYINSSPPRAAKQ
ncbi:hypothetical protein SAMD00019534_056790 [Acytostelium subglobosum LB1]|uniref:hypothetical protein n=1 Tax=Acytostelium subglobosum LB1 TaxID=1410327 RepID=UPI0006448957|nr:hypothetical protein SAMD00019534_056790 [Acytostelium subglobosum LB1]GAM22504.1 hypothetical protein SAMD00019534_056790 [Acytostelium subglobosum LB1]|eukprot:XP_012754624.1 hypothetical protein SAMD00019534_056790 [Acytostelium subglobosum LB1]